MRADIGHAEDHDGLPKATAVPKETAGIRVSPAAMLITTNGPTGSMLSRNTKLNPFLRAHIIAFRTLGLAAQRRMKGVSAAFRISRKVSKLPLTSPIQEYKKPSHIP
ncbi:hypothetical protein HMSSN036_74230 [Paenibacillus macerans]|nr:hypothetical protein HMSSN036_74230 [Paenibacillus macerans]